MIGKVGQCRATRVAEAEQFRGLVERLADGIVAGVAEQSVAAQAVDLDQLGVAA
jgi:hypothetical protein